VQVGGYTGSLESFGGDGADGGYKHSSGKLLLKWFKAIDLVCYLHGMIDLLAAGEEGNINLTAGDLKDSGLELRGVVREAPGVDGDFMDCESLVFECIEELRVAPSIFPKSDPFMSNRIISGGDFFEEFSPRVGFRCGEKWYQTELFE